MSENYFQLLMDIIIEDGYTYEAIADSYDCENITVESLRRAHRDSKRGNLPSGTTPEQFYDKVVKNFYKGNELKAVAMQLNCALIRESCYPDEWRERSEYINGFEENFNKEIFRLFVIYLLKQDRKKRNGNSGSDNNETKKDNTPFNYIDAYNFSKKFLSSKVVTALKKESFLLETELNRLSSVFGNISELSFFDVEKNTTVKSESIILSLYSLVSRELQDDTRKILKIKGPLGSYKNMIMQWLFIAISMNEADVIPFYIDMSCYEKEKYATEELIVKKFKKDIVAAETLIAKNHNAKPLFIIDGIRDFFFVKEALAYQIKDSIVKKNYRIIICEDSDYTINGLQKHQIHPVATDNYQICLRIKSMNLIRRKESVEFIDNCMKAFGEELIGEFNPETVYEHLVKLNFMTIDAYWLIYFLKMNRSSIAGKENNISNLYNSICLDFLGSPALVDKASKFAYDFEFGKLDSVEYSSEIAQCLSLLRKHRSVLDYLIAREYVKKISKLNLSKENHSNAVRELSFFNMVMQKNITRFVVAIINGVDDYEHQIMIIARYYYDELGLFGKSELTFWMARLKNPQRKKECVKLLKEYNKKEIQKYSEGMYGSREEKRDIAFLLRGINVSLIYEGDKEALNYYLNSLISDKIANSVNRGFHLEYYGDKPYIPNKTLIDFEDDITKGEYTLTVLCLSLERRIKRTDVTSYVSLIEIMTLCNLIQARIEYNENNNSFDVTPYIDKCIRYLKWIISLKLIRNLGDVPSYLNWMYNELRAFQEKAKNSQNSLCYKKSTVINRFGKACNVKRTGWVKMNVENPENIVEHMYNCWLIGMLYLPNECDVEGYNKNEILNILLIHDLGEAETGDINRPQKRSNQEYYDHQERVIMHSFTLSGTYPNSVGLDLYRKCWNIWDEKKSINYQVAKDIDNLQTIYQFCNYCLNYPEICTDENIHYWLKGLEELETEIVKDIAVSLISENDAFSEIVARNAH